jgi:hypothetical protein
MTYIYRKQPVSDQQPPDHRSYQQKPYPGPGALHCPVAAVPCHEADCAPGSDNSDNPARSHPGRSPSSFLGFRPDARAAACMLDNGNRSHDEKADCAEEEFLDLASEKNVLRIVRKEEIPVAAAQQKEELRRIVGGKEEEEEEEISVVAPPKNQVVVVSTVENGKSLVVPVLLAAHVHKLRRIVLACNSENMIFSLRCKVWCLGMLSSRTQRRPVWIVRLGILPLFPHEPAAWQPYSTTSFPQW